MADESSTQFFLPRVVLPPSLSEREIFLEITEGPDRGKSFGPLLAPVRIGSARGNDVVLADPTVSRFHCTIERGEHGPRIVDAGSTNSTILGSFRVIDAYLAEGAQIRLGQTVLTARISAETRRVELSASTTFGGLIGESHAMRALFATLGRIAPADVPVLIEGATGTGKELVARALHAESPRRERSFVVVDCGAVSPTLIESELFGHEKGAFTGAESARAGAFELAEGGTIFLDELGELPIALQPKLLRVIEAGTVKRLGAAQEKKVSARIIAATHRNLRQMVNAGTFREDLYFRLAVLPIRIPPLSERVEDIVLLAQHFFGRALRAIDQANVVLSAETAAVLRAQAWPGNVRELRNAIERAVILGEPAEVSRGELAPALRLSAPAGSVSASVPIAAHGAVAASELKPIALEEAKRLFEREYLIKLLARYPDDQAGAAAEAELHVKSLQRLIRRHQLRGG